MKEYDIVVPVLIDDAKKLIKNYKILRKNLTFKNLVLIGDSKVKEEVDKLKDKNIKFIDENKLVKNLNFSEVEKLIINRGGNPKRTGWYLQQFIKLGYAYKCKDEYYLTWDSDTMPLKKVEMFNKNNIPYFDVKTEYHKPYFNTIDTLFDNKYKRELDVSFISEHMLFNTNYVLEMLNEIESNDKIVGEKYYEKIINGINNINDLNNSGFSEFETYGVYINQKYSNKYEIRNWKSLREGIFYFPLPMSQKQIKWVSKKYDAISFEKHDTLSKINKIWNNSFVYKHFSIDFILKITYPYMQIRKVFKILFKKKK